MEIKKKSGEEQSDLYTPTLYGYESNSLDLYRYHDKYLTATRTKRIDNGCSLSGRRQEHK
jgi:hypothetical protein